MIHISTDTNVVNSILQAKIVTFDNTLLGFLQKMQAILEAEQTSESIISRGFVPSVA